MHATIKYSAYSLTRTDLGWRVTANANPTDHFYRSYLVQVDADGRPLSCSCPHHVHKAAHCKHMAAVEEKWRAEHPEATAQLDAEAERAGAVVEPEHWMVQGQYVKVFAPRGDRVHVRTYLRGEQTFSETLTRPEARTKWTALVAAGWSKF